MLLLPLPSLEGHHRIASRLLKDIRPHRSAVFCWFPEISHTQCRFMAPFCHSYDLQHSLCRGAMDENVHESDHTRKSPLREPQAKVFHYIEKTFNNIISSIQIRPSGRPSIILKRITVINSRGPDEGWHVDGREMKISFPGKNRDETWRFGEFWTTVALSRLSFVHSLRG